MLPFPQLLKKIRDTSGLTQGQLSKVLGVSEILITLIETDQQEVSKRFINLLADKMDVSPNSLTPFILKPDETKELSSIEKQLITLGERLQTYLIKKKAKNLARHVGIQSRIS